MVSVLDSGILAYCGRLLACEAGGSKMLTKAMSARVTFLCTEWKDEGDGFYSLIGQNPILGFPLVYIALPKGHPDIDKDYDKLDVEVNGGLTFGDDNVFGWDYGHFQNPGIPKKDIKNALKFFKERMVKKC